ncbi:MAG: hypothetical protein ACTHMY_03440 [Solirubrobacteraceae bacterium]
MGTLIRLSDHSEVFLVGEPEGYIRGIADALNLETSVTDVLGNPVPKGFLRWHDDGTGEDIVVNAAQIVSVRAGDRPSPRPEPFQASRPITAGLADQQF